MTKHRVRGASPKTSSSALNGSRSLLRQRTATLPVSEVSPAIELNSPAAPESMRWVENLDGWLARVDFQTRMQFQ